jgi:1-acyl-sn-glycerol-3-phosphate acyltransferase
MTVDAAAQLAHESPNRRNWVWFSFQMLLQVVFTTWLRYRARGAADVPETGGALFVVNHQSFLDPLLVGLPLRRPVSYLARDSLFRVPVIGWILRNTYVQAINREAASSSVLRETVRRMEAGYLCGIFPEGTRSVDGTVGVFKPGFVALVRRANSPVIPVGIAGAHAALGRGSWFLWPRRVCVVFGEPLSVAELEAYREKGREQDLVDLVRQRVVACQAEAEAWRHSPGKPE